MCEVDPNCGSGTVDLCQTIPQFTGSQVLDGSPDEFCVPSMTFALNDAGWVNPVYMATRPTVVTARVGWSVEALHVHMHVDDPAIYSSLIAANKWDGDSVQVFLAGTDLLTGLYTGTQDGGATHIVAAPDGTAIELFETTTTPVARTLAGVSSRFVTGGYEVELMIPWASTANLRSSGASFGFNLGATADDTGGGIELEGMLANNAVSLPAAACTSTATPGCDDRTWCTPTLE
jgi:hypothetical protein